VSEREPTAGSTAGPPEEDPRIAGEKHPIARMIALGIVASLIGIAIALSIPWFPKSASTSADKIDTVYDVLLICSVPIFVLVMTVALYSVWRFRAKPGDMRDGAPIHGNTRLEIVWVTIPFLMVTALAIYGWITLDDIEAKQPDTMIINVTGRQFTWSFQYPHEKVNSDTLVLAKNRPVEFRIHTKDVLHSFWVPEFRLKSDAVPGMPTKIRVTPNRIGSYQVVCAELCGVGHSTMRQSVRVVSASDFNSWIDRQKKPPATAQAGGGGGGGGGAAKPKGAQVFADNGCGSCHTLAIAHATGTVGPNLGKIKNATAAFIRESIVDPNKDVTKGFPPNTMPQNFGTQLSKDELDALVDYILKAQK
jgi:cytochrome c oxidase subunit II